jgi:hypothetical protein
MMRSLRPGGWEDLATRRDLQSLEQRLDHKIDSRGQRVDARIDSLGQRLDARIDRVELRLNARLDAMTDAMSGMATKADLADSRYELQRTLVTWILAAQATVVAAVGLLIAFLR